MILHYGLFENWLFSGMRFYIILFLLILGLHAKGQDTLTKIPMTDVVYITEIEDINLEQKETNQVKGDVLEDSLVNKKGLSIHLTKLTFKGGEHTLEPQAFLEIERIRDFMFQHPTMTIEIQGHICCKTDGEDGFDSVTWTNNLSVQRAKQVNDELIKRGVESDRITYVGFGSSRKIIKDDFGKPEAAQINRRVEIKIISE